MKDSLKEDLKGWVDVLGTFGAIILSGLAVMGMIMLYEYFFTNTYFDKYVLGWLGIPAWIIVIALCWRMVND